MGSARKILWHDGFASGYKKIMSDGAKDRDGTEINFEEYTDKIIKYAKQYDYNTVSLTALGSEISEGFLPDSKTAYKYINRFIVKAEAEGLSVGLNVFQKDGKTDTVDQLVKDISENITSTKPLTIGIDSEDNELTAKTYDTYKDKWETALQKYGVNYDDFIILGGAAQEKTWTPSSNFKNGYEYYSIDAKWYAPVWDPGTFNTMLSTQYLNNPDGALQYLKNNINAGNIIDPLTGGEYNGVVPVFSIGTGKNNTLGQVDTKAKPSIGPDVFGTWDPEPFNQFISAWNEAYEGTTDIIVYHADQLPRTWYENL